MHNHSDTEVDPSRPAPPEALPHAELSAKEVALLVAFRALPDADRAKWVAATRT